MRNIMMIIVSLLLLSILSCSEDVALQSTIFDDSPGPEVEENEVFNPLTGRIWMDRNLGASRVATNSTDEAAYGDLYQWGRAADGHEKRNSPTTTTLSDTDQPGHGYFIVNENFPHNWQSPGSDNLWQGANGINNPCPEGYRLPTKEEWEAEIQSWYNKDGEGAITSPLKLPQAGYRDHSSGSLDYVESSGYYWSSTASSFYSNYLSFNRNHSNVSSTGGGSRGYGYSVRCIKD